MTTESWHNMLSIAMEVLPVSGQRRAYTRGLCDLYQGDLCISIHMLYTVHRDFYEE